MYPLYEALKDSNCKLKKLLYVCVSLVVMKVLTSPHSLHGNLITKISLPFLIEALWSKTCSLEDL
jgi:hypothetical protein